MNKSYIPNQTPPGTKIFGRFVFRRLVHAFSREGLEEAKSYRSAHKWLLWTEGIGLAIVYGLIFTIGSAAPIPIWIISAISAGLVAIYVYFIRELLVVVAWMWVPTSITAIAAGLLFLSDQGIDLGVGLLGTWADNRTKYLLLAPVLFYWAFASWHAGRRSLDRRFPTFPELREDQIGFLPWLRWPPRLLGICAHLFAAINLALAVGSYLRSLSEAPHFSSSPLIPASMFNAEFMNQAVFRAPQEAAWKDDITAGLTVLVTWSPVIVIALAALFIWSMDKTIAVSDNHTPPPAPWTKWTSLILMLSVMAIFVVGSQANEMPPGLFPAAASIFISAAAFMTIVAATRSKYVRDYSDQMRHDAYRFAETIIGVLVAFIGFGVYSLVFANDPMRFGNEIGSMVTAFFAFGAIISIIDAFSLPVDYYLKKARHSAEIERLWTSFALDGEKHRRAAKGPRELELALEPEPDRDPAPASRIAAFARAYTKNFDGLDDAKKALWLQRTIFPMVCGATILIAIGASQTRTYDEIRQCDDRACLGDAPYGAVATRPDVAKTVDAWYDQAKSAWDKRNDHDPLAPVPLVIVATAGGGIRAAYWTATVLETLRNELGKGWSAPPSTDSLRPYLFAISSVSGGSLGAAAYSATLQRDEKEGKPLARPTQYLEADFLAPALATLFLHDLPATVLPFLGWSDRGVALERSFEAASDYKLRAPFLSFFPPAADFGYVDNSPATEPNPAREKWITKDEWRPVFLFNATHQETGRRIIQSHLLVEKSVFLDAYDALDLFGSDTRMSTAIMDSARFLYVSPPGHLPPGPKGEDRGYVLDGGYYDNFGARTALELVEEVERVLRPDRRARVDILVLQISSDPSMRSSSRARLIDASDGCHVSTAGSGSARNFLKFEDAPFNWLTLSSKGDDEGPEINFLNEVWSPLAGVLSTRESRGRAASEELADHMCSSRPGYFFHLAMCNPDSGTGEGQHIVPPLGWVLSKPSQEQFKQIMNICGNDREMEKLVSRIVRANDSR